MNKILIIILMVFISIGAFSCGSSHQDVNPQQAQITCTDCPSHDIVLNLENGTYINIKKGQLND